MLGAVLSFSGGDNVDAKLINTSAYHANRLNEDKIIIHMKEVVKDVTAGEKEQSTKN